MRLGEERANKANMCGSKAIFTKQNVATIPASTDEDVCGPLRSRKRPQSAAGKVAPADHAWPPTLLQPSNQRYTNIENSLQQPQMHVRSSNARISSAKDKTIRTRKRLPGMESDDYLLTALLDEEVNGQNFSQRVPEHQQKVNASHSSVLGRLRKSQSTANMSNGVASNNAFKTPVERLLQQDGVYQHRIQSQRSDLSTLTLEHERFSAEILKVKKRIKGVHAVRDNDIAVANCVSIMQKRVVKAEKECMTLKGTHRDMKTQVDTSRREILTLVKVNEKLKIDLEQATRMQAELRNRLDELHLARSQVADDLVQEERNGELELEEHRLLLENLSLSNNEQNCDVERLMRAAETQSLKKASEEIGTKISQLRYENPIELMMTRKMLRMRSSKKLVGFQKAFQIVSSLSGFSGTIQSFVTHFSCIEQQLLSTYKMNVLLEEELSEMQNEFNVKKMALNMRLESVRATREATEARGRQLTSINEAIQAKLEHYNTLLQQRYSEKRQLVSILQRCLVILQAKKSGLISSTTNTTGDQSEADPSILLHLLQRRLSEFDVLVAGLDFHNEVSEVLVTDFHSVHKVRTVLGPKEPPGAALECILAKIQPPSVSTCTLGVETMDREEISCQKSERKRMLAS
uniref:Uncharacterized protein AlNc14C340G10789 n=1 Tax=Albugo laibachii Nc14 TaxID=890382 RepID=F0WX32_9STRA|nr:conserved hypothetical protein [Albugo laibachii Nc14]|eukprot:CCA26021.1 conserved hypothetical protein [Albugo laibachii Nc14]